MCYAAYKLWNVCNYERNNYKNLGLEKYPDWYDQKSKHKDDLWFKSLPSQTAQEICKLLDKSWKSFYRLKESGGIENPRTPRYKKDKMPITYMQNGIQHENGSYNVRLSLPKKLKEYMAHTYDIRAAYLYLKNPVFSNMNIIKQIKIYPPANDGTSRILVIYEVEDVFLEEDNGHYLSIDLGLHNLMTCYDNAGKTFIIGREYLSLSYFYNKEIGKLGENGEYTATIGAPISAALQTDAPQFTAISDGTSSSTSATKFTGVVPITLKGADAIKSVPNDCVTMADSNTNVTNNEVSLKSIHVDKVEQSPTGLNVTVSVTTGGMGGVWNENSLVPKFSDGKLPNISIDTSKLQLKENTLGWYLPTDTLNLGNMTVHVLTPAFTGVYPAVDPTTGNPTFTIHTQNMPENAKVEVALAKTSVNAADIEKATIKATATRGNDGDYSVTFDKSKFESGVEYYLWFRYGSPGSDWAYESVTNRPTYTPNSTTGGGSDSSESGSGNTTEGSQAGA